ncbi:MAG: acyl carrier protein [Acidobacteriaceae bacterium]|nr:acyl carrier protein [Acidobacteriaceae bacterium]MBV9306446.1 acyl carrier protein [Acidobacteriaceae bacterium]MBV9939124.1 acyl carrier protein [Acidobacteriaceae bacterium]
MDAVDNSQRYHEIRPMPETPETDQLSSRVINVIAKTQRIPAESIAPDSTFNQLKIDSLDGINIIFALENEFGIEIPDEGINNMRSVREVTEGIEKLMAAKAQTTSPGAV